MQVWEEFLLAGGSKSEPRYGKTKRRRFAFPANAAADLLVKARYEIPVTNAG
jgi:hypothetical protein